MSWRADKAWIASAFLLALAFVWHEMAILGDGFWCLAAGEFVLRTHSLPSEDPFSFTARHVPWVLHMPAFQIGGAWLVAHAGLRTFMAVCTLPIACAALLLWVAPTRGLLARLIVLPVVVLYLIVDADDISARGQAFGDLAFVALLILLARIESGAPPTPWWAFGLGVSWANFHPSFLLAVALPIAFAAAEWLEPSTWRVKQRPFVVFAAVALLGACVNPSSVVLPLDTLKLLANPTTAKIDLFRPPDFRSIRWLAAIAIAVVLLLWSARSAANGRARADAALLITFVAAACIARRYSTHLVAFEALLLAKAANAIDWPLPRRWLNHFLWSAAGLQGLLSAWWLSERKDPFRDVPVESVLAIDRLGLPDRVLNPYHWGGYLDWVWRGERKVFIDGRNQLFSNGVFDDMQSLAALKPQAATLLDVYEIGTVLWENGAALDRALAQAPGWREVHRDRLAVVYARHSRGRP